MKTIQHIFGAGDKHTFPGGRYFHFLIGSGPLKVTFIKNSSPIDVAEIARPGYFADFRGRTNERIEFDAVEVESATAQTVEVGISKDAGGYARFSGSVEVSNQPTVKNLNDTKELAKGDKFFSFGRQVVAAGGTQYAHSQIYNPSGSGIKTIIRKITISPLSNCNIEIGRYDTELLTTLNALNKNIGAAASETIHHEESRTSVLFAPILKVFRLLANRPYDIEMKAPFILSEGQGILIVPETPQGVNYDLNIEYEEE